MREGARHRAAGHRAAREHERPEEEPTSRVGAPQRNPTRKRQFKVNNFPQYLPNYTTNQY